MHSTTQKFTVIKKIHIPIVNNKKCLYIYFNTTQPIRFDFNERKQL